jgi:hypothetical protein
MRGFFLANVGISSACDDQFFCYQVKRKGSLWSFAVHYDCKIHVCIFSHSNVRTAAHSSGGMGASTSSSSVGFMCASLLTIAGGMGALLALAGGMGSILTVSGGMGASAWSVVGGSRSLHTDVVIQH